MTLRPTGLIEATTGGGGLLVVIDDPDAAAALVIPASFNHRRVVPREDLAALGTMHPAREPAGGCQPSTPDACEQLVGDLLHAADVAKHGEENARDRVRALLASLRPVPSSGGGGEQVTLWRRPPGGEWSPWYAEQPAHPERSQWEIQSATFDRVGGDRVTLPEEGEEGLGLALSLGLLSVTPEQLAAAVEALPPVVDDREARQRVARAAYDAGQRWVGDLLGTIDALADPTPALSPETLPEEPPDVAKLAAFNAIAVWFAEVEMDDEAAVVARAVWDEARACLRTPEPEAPSTEPEQANARDDAPQGPLVRRLTGAPSDPSPAPPVSPVGDEEGQRARLEVDQARGLVIQEAERELRGKEAKRHLLDSVGQFYDAIERARVAVAHREAAGEYAEIIQRGAELRAGLEEGRSAPDEQGPLARGLLVECPICDAAVGAACSDPGGEVPFNGVHVERWNFANETSAGRSGGQETGA